MAENIKASQIETSAEETVEEAIARLDSFSILGNFSGSAKIGDAGTIKTGTIPSTAVISANSYINVTVTFPEPFTTACHFFDAILTPSISADFYGVVSLVSLTKNSAVFTVKNGAVAQAVASGRWLALGD